MVLVRAGMGAGRAAAAATAFDVVVMVVVQPETFVVFGTGAGHLAVGGCSAILVLARPAGTVAVGSSFVLPRMFRWRRLEVSPTRRASSARAARSGLNDDGMLFPWTPFGCVLRQVVFPRNTPDLSAASSRTRVHLPSVVLWFRTVYELFTAGRVAKGYSGTFRGFFLCRVDFAGFRCDTSVTFVGLAGTDWLANLERRRTSFRSFLGFALFSCSFSRRLG